MADMTLEQYASAALFGVLSTARDMGMPPGPMILFEGGPRRGTIILDGFIDASETGQQEAANMVRQTLREAEATRYALIGAAWAIESRSKVSTPETLAREPDRFEVIFVYAEDEETCVAMVVRPSFGKDGRLRGIDQPPRPAEAIPNKMLSGMLKRAETIQ